MMDDVINQHDDNGRSLHQEDHGCYPWKNNLNTIKLFPATNEHCTIPQLPASAASAPCYPVLLHPELTFNVEPKMIVV